MLVKRIKVITRIIIAVIIFAAAAAIYVVNEQTVSVVKSIAMSENTSSSITVSWHEVKGADGYHIYLSKNDGTVFEKVADVNDGKTCSYQIENIESGDFYKINVTAYKIFNDEKYEGEPAEEISAYSLPSAPDLSASSAEEGVLSAQWSEQKNAVSYELEYAKSDNFSDAVKEKLTENGFMVEGLQPHDIYFVRVRSVMKAGSKKVYGDWSETCRVGIRKKPVMNPDIDPDKPLIALSFDDGPAFEYEGCNSTMEILNVLEEHGARATFFMCGSRINDENTACLKKEIELGCELGNHTYDHRNYGHKVTTGDIVKSSNAIRDASGQLPTIFRCPGGIITQSIREECKKEGMPLAYWSVDTEDWKSQDPKKIYDEVMKHAYDGAIILMHDIYPTTAEAVKKIVPQLIEDGYQVVTISEMIAVRNDGNAPVPGQQYVDYNTINNNT